MMKAALRLGILLTLVCHWEIAKGLTITRPIVVEVSPPDAEVTLRVENKKGEPEEAPSPARQVAVNGRATFAEVRIPTDGRVVLAASRDEYAPVDGIAYSHAEARADRKSQQVISIRLERLVERIPVLVQSEQPDTRIELNGVTLADGRGEMLFRRSRTNEAYSGSHTVVLSRERFREMRRTFDWNGIQAAHRDTEGRRVLTLGLEEIERVVTLRIRTDVVDATVLIDGEVAGVTTLSPGATGSGSTGATLAANLIYRRTTAADPYPSRTVRVEKLGFEYRPTAGDRRPNYETNLVVADAEALRGELVLRGFQPVEYVDSPVRIYDVVETRAGEWDLAVVQTNALSALKPADQASPLPQLSRSRQGPMVVSKLAVVASGADEAGGDRILVSAPVWEQRADGTLEAVGANVCSIQGATVTVHTKGAFDVDPCTDGEQLYFSSNRGGYRGIWKIGLGGKGGWTPVVQKDADFIDTEPAAVLVDGVLRFAFTRRNAKAAANAVPRVMVKFPGNEQPSEMEPGHSPAWSPKGDLLAFISPDHKLWLMRHDGTEARQLTTGSSIEASPVWHPTGQFILFASNESLNSMGKQNFDLFQIAPDGSRRTQLTSDGSFDGSPAVAPNGRRVYFFSNRGAQPLKPESLQIYSMDLQF
jgi:hypothetical protein